MSLSQQTPRSPPKPINPNHFNFLNKHFYVQACQNLHIEQDAQIQSVVALFDLCMGYLDPDNEDEILLYHLVACIYIYSKTDKGFSGLTFSTYLY